jgi:hypothetical protein
LAPGRTAGVTVTFDSTGLAAGNYSGNLVIDSNDPATPQATVPVQLTVLNCMYVQPIEGSFIPDRSGRTRIDISVTVLDAGGLPLGSVAVTGELMGSSGVPVQLSAKTNNHTGTARFQARLSDSSPWEFCVTTLTKAGYSTPQGYLPLCEYWP